MIARALVGLCAGRPPARLTLLAAGVALLGAGAWLAPMEDLTAVCVLAVLAPGPAGWLACRGRGRSARARWVGLHGGFGCLLLAGCAPVLGPAGSLQTAGALLCGLEVLTAGRVRMADPPGGLAPLPAGPSRLRWLPAGVILLAGLVGWVRSPPVVTSPAVTLGAGLVCATAILVQAAPLRGLVLAASLAAAGGLIGWARAPLAPAAALPLAAWLGAGLQGGAAGRTDVWPARVLTALWLAFPALLFLVGPPGPADLPCLAGAVLAWLAGRSFLVGAPGRCGGMDGVLRAVARAAGVLPTPWRLYTRAKLARDPLYRLLADEPGPWGRVLDAGCGSGLTAGICARRTDVCAYTGLDLDRGKLLLARALLARLGRDLDGDWRLAVRELPDGLPAGPADTVLALDLLHYWPAARQADLLAALAGHLAADGRLYLRECPADAPGAGRVAAGEGFTTAIGLDPPTARLHFPTGAELRDRLAAAGLSVAAEYTAGGANRLLLCVRREGGWAEG